MQYIMETSELLMPCVPALLARRAVRHPVPPTRPVSECFPAAVLLADVSGFTQLTERSAQQGSAGAEELSRLLEKLFAPLVEVVAAHGGDLLHFPGDALLALWPAGESEGALAEGVWRAAGCGLALQAAMNTPAIQELSLSLRVAVGAGEVQLAVVGGVHGRWQALVRGQPFTQLRDAERTSAPGEVVLSAEAWRCVGTGLGGDALSTGGARVTPGQELSPVPLPPPALPPEAGAALRPFVSRALRAAQEVGKQWLAELRRATVLFLRLDGLPDEASEGLLPRLADAVCALQEAIYAFGGSINQLLVDDKGMVLVAAFGLPTCAHEDDAVRAVRAALHAREALRTLGLRAAAGIATGRVCCGLRGGARRHEYAVMGQVVNLAARLMQEAWDGVLLDEATSQAIGERIWAERLPPVKLKGVAEPVHRFRPGGIGEARSHLSAGTLVGRAEERAVLDVALECLARGQGGTLVVEGEAGMGKSRLLAYAAEGARARGFRLLCGRGDATESATVYHAWRSVFATWLGLAPTTTAEARRAALLARLAQVPGALELAPLLNPVLLLSLPETERTFRLRDRVRADTTLSLMVRLLGELGPAVLLLEDGHWLDSYSWELFRRLARDVPGWLLVLSTRPHLDSPPPAMEALLRLPSTRRMRLPAMPREDILALVCARLGVARLQDEVGAFIQQKAEGHPFYSEELAYALRDNGLLLVERGECRLAPGAGSLDSLGLPSTLEGLITSRIDRLTAVQQLTLKAASVIGRTFGRELLADLHPLPEERGRLDEHLLRLHSQDLTSPLGTSPEPSYIFKHVITQEVTYNLLLFSQRRQLHEAVARWYERTHAEELTSLYPLLAYHWIRANMRLEALEALEKAGEHALAARAPREAAGFFSKALELEAEGPDRVEPLRRARWERNLGRALRWLGRRAEAQLHLSRALQLLGFPVPAGRGALAVGMVLGVTRQLLGWLPGSRWLRRREVGSESLVEAAEACADLALLAYYALDLPMLGFHLFQMANLSDRSGVASLRAQAYAAMTVVLGSVPLHGLARAYGRASMRLVLDSGDQDALHKIKLPLSLYLLDAGRFSEAEVTLSEGLEGLNRIGSLRLADETGFLLLNLRIFQGRLTEAAALTKSLEASALKREDEQMVRWAREDWGRVLLRMGRVAEALEVLRTLPRSMDPIGMTSLAGSLSLAWLRCGKPQQARMHAEAHAELALRMPLSLTVLDGYTGLAETFHELWLAARTRGEQDAAALEHLTRRFCRALARGARACAVALPAARLAQGRMLLAYGRPRAARRRFEAAARAARDLGMPHEEAAAHCLLAGLEAANQEVPRGSAPDTALRPPAAAMTRASVQGTTAGSKAMLAPAELPRSRKWSPPPRRR